MYEYRAIVTKVYDGDTITVSLDLGFGVWIKGEKVRLASINAPEVRGASRPLGIISRDYLRELILNKEVTITTYKDKKGKYGRYIGNIFLKKGDTEILVNDLMVKEGHAIYQEY